MMEKGILHKEFTDFEMIEIVTENNFTDSDLEVIMRWNKALRKYFKRNECE